MTIEFWYLIGAVLVFFMQAGFTMVETGFTRAKNAGNVIMKNLMDFCIGTVVFSLLGYSLMMGEDTLFGLVGLPNMDLWTDFTGYISTPKDGSFTNASNFFFNLVFCATASTIVSGTMAERTKFSAYCIYSAVISAFIYPIQAHWIWGGGWLGKLGFYDFAGSCAIHMVGGITALIGAIFLGPRIGKYVKDSLGKVIKINAIPAHSITLGALGVFILWLGWYGFNGAAARSVNELASIFMTTTISPAAATCTTMIYTWIKNGKPDVSMCLNASLAGLVAITAGCNALDAQGAAAVGIISGIIVVVVVELLDLKFHIDDPVGAVGVHLANGIWGTIAVGLLANPNSPAGLNGLLYTGSFKLLGIQTLGVAAVFAYTSFFMIITFALIKKANGLRAFAEDEIAGLDMSEHGLSNAYADFVPVTDKSFSYKDYKSISGISDNVSAAELIDFKNISQKNSLKFTKIEIICKESKFDSLKKAMTQLGITGMTVSHVLGCGMQRGKPEYYRGVPVETNLLPKVQVEIVVSKIPVRSIIETAKKVLYSGHIGDGKIFIYNVENVIKVRTGEEGYAALQDVE